MFVSYVFDYVLTRCFDLAYIGIHVELNVNNMSTNINPCACIVHGL